MIPGPLFTLPMLLLLLAPLVAAGLSLWLLLRGLFWWRRHRHAPASKRPPFWHWPVVVVAILALAGDLWGLVLARKLVQIEDAVTLRAHYRESRQRFVLPEDFRYGEQLFPKGTLINRYDAFDNGERQRPLGLRGLSAARFAQPVQIAGAWVNAIGNHTVELARDQRLGPVFHFDPDVDPGYGAWVVDPKRSYLECRKGDIASLHVPLIGYDIQAEFLVGAPDGPEARYRPSQWGYIDCQAGKPAIEVQPAYDGPAPSGAHLPVWGTLIPNED